MRTFFHFSVRKYCTKSLLTQNTVKKTGYFARLSLFILFLLPAYLLLGQTTQTFTTTTTWLCPAGVTSVNVECWAGGGAGGGATGNPAAGGGGAGGSYVKNTSIAVTAGTIYTVTVGTGAIGNTGNGAAGNDSWFINSGTILAKGGLGGARANSNNQTSAGALAISSGNVGFTAPFSYYGGAGGTGVAAGVSGGGGGASAGTGSNGNGAIGITAGIAVTGGGAGVNGSASSADGTDNTNLGGGGAGGRAGSGTDRNGGDGGNGQVILTYTQPSCPLSTAVTPSATQSGCVGFTVNVLTAAITLAGTSGTPTLLYQWYYNTTNSNTVAGATLIAGATSVTYTPSTLSAGTRYYFCVGYATNNSCAETNATQSLASNTVQVTVSATLTGNYLVGTGQTYTTLTAAIAAYNSSCLSGPVSFLLTNNGGTYTAGETFPISINANASASSANTLTIKPNTGVTTTISGSASNNAVIRVVGKYITIDGSNNGSTSRDLTITNTNTTSPTVTGILSSGITPVNNITLKNCIVINGSLASSAIVVSDATTLGNPGYFTNITIQNNDVRKAYIGIYSTANPAAGNGSGLNITSNLLNTSGANAIENVGIYLQGVDGGTVSGNNVGNFETATAESDRGIWLATGCTNCLVEKNTIHDLVYTGTSGYAGQGIVLSTGLLASNNTISNNMINNLSGDGDSYTTYGAYYSPVGIYAFGTGQGGINIYYNSIYLSGNTLNKNNTASIGIALDNNTMAAIKNNIILNNLGRLGGTGINTMGIAAVTSNTQFTSLDYNDYYCNATGTGTNVIGRIAATNYTTLATWKTASAQETNSLNIAPVFSSASDLHLQAPIVNEPLNAMGTAVSAVSTDYDGQTRNTITPDMGADEFKGWGSWVGASSSSWTTATNWYDNYIPLSTTNVEIETASFMPVVSSSTYSIKNLVILSPGMLTISGTGILQIAGRIGNTGTFNASGGTIEMNGTVAQTIPAVAFQNNNVKNLIISNTDAATGVTLAGALDIYRSLNFSASGLKLTTGGFLTFKSTATETAWLGDMTGKTITGSVTVERYIPNHAKAWQFLAVPTTGQTVNAAWQEGNAPLAVGTAGLGTIITNNVAGVGFDIIAGNSPSIKTYDTTAKTWVGIANTGVLIDNQRGYMLFVRGDRSVQSTSTPATATNLRTKGTLYTPANPPSVVNLAANTFQSVGNPYPSAIDLTLLSRTGGVQDLFYIWDPKLTTSPSAYGLGAYQTFTRSGATYNVTPGGGSYPSGICKTIESGQAFFIRAPSATGSLSFSESCKLAGSNDVNRIPMPAMVKQLRTNLRVITGETSVLIDGTLLEFDDSFSNNIDMDDALKLGNTGENLGLLRKGNILVAEHRATISATDTVFYNLGQLKIRQYQFEFKPAQFNQPGMGASLEDNYLHTSTPVSLKDPTTVTFNVVNVPGSYAAGRFRLVFRQLKQTVGIAVASSDAKGSAANEVGANSKVTGKGIDPVKLIPGITVYPNPVVDKTMHIKFINQIPGNYSVQLIGRSGQLVYTGTIQLTGSDMIKSIQLNESIATGSYQLHIVSAEGIGSIQQVVIK